MICAVQTFVNCCTPATAAAQLAATSFSHDVFFNLLLLLLLRRAAVFSSLALSIEANYCNAIKLRTDRCAKLQLQLQLLLLL